MSSISKQSRPLISNMLPSVKTRFPDCIPRDRNSPESKLTRIGISQPTDEISKENKRTCHDGDEGNRSILIVASQSVRQFGYSRLQLFFR